MEDYLDEICLIGLCAAVVAIPSNDPLAIAGLLCALIVVCTRAASRAIQGSVQSTFIVCACFSPALFTFLPVVAYSLMRNRWLPARAFWMVPLIVQIALYGMSAPWVQVALLCVIACLLGVRESRVASERKGLAHAYDSLRERMITRPHHSEAEQAPVQEQEPALFEDLTQREIAVVQLVAEGLDNREISQRLFLSEGTVRNHISSVLAKKGLANRTQIAVLYYTT